jgi:hypothetical protein
MLTLKNVSAWNMDIINKLLASGTCWKLIGASSSKRNKQKKKEETTPGLLESAWPACQIVLAG